MLTLSSGLGVDLAALGRTLGTATLLAMLQILDQSLSRMRTSGHAPLLAEMAVIRLATLEDLESVTPAVDRLASATAVAPPAPQKKTTELTAPAAEPSRSESAAPAPPANASPVEPVIIKTRGRVGAPCSKSSTHACTSARIARTASRWPASEPARAAATLATGSAA
jgi:DNA polymerase III gamma/tau subunit